MGTTVYAPKPVLGVRVDYNGADGAVTVTRPLLVIDATLYAASTVAGGTLVLNNNATAITDTMDASGDKNITRAGTIDDAQNAVAAAGTINVVRGGAVTGTVTIICLPN